jgi:hypothetical protein
MPAHGANSLVARNKALRRSQVLKRRIFGGLLKLSTFLPLDDSRRKEFYKASPAVILMGAGG